MRVTRGLAVWGCATMLACGSRTPLSAGSTEEVERGSGGAAGSAGSAGGAGVVDRPPGQPPRPPQGAPDGSALPRAVFAVRAWRFGNVNAAGVKDPAGCKNVGFNLDGRAFPPPASKAQAKQHCKGAINDGPSGVDNASGCTLGAEEGWLSAGAAAKVPVLGRATVLLVIDHLGPASSYTGTPGLIMSAVGIETAAGAPVAPTDQQWKEGSYPWRPLAGHGTAKGCCHGSAEWTTGSALTSGYIVDDTWVAGGFGPFSFAIPFLSYPNGPGLTWLPLVVRHGWITARITADRRRLVDGVLGGIISHTDIRAAIDIVGPGGMCEKDISASLLDMGLDGEQDPNGSCEAASFGVGFEAELTTLGDEAPAPHQEPWCSL